MRTFQESLSRVYWSLRPEGPATLRWTLPWSSQWPYHALQRAPPNVQVRARKSVRGGWPGTVAGTDPRIMMVSALQLRNVAHSAEWVQRYGSVGLGPRSDGGWRSPPNGGPFRRCPVKGAAGTPQGATGLPLYGAARGLSRQKLAQKRPRSGGRAPRSRSPGAFPPLPVGRIVALRLQFETRCRQGHSAR
jgi:hypothetical protein